MSRIGNGEKVLRKMDITETIKLGNILWKIAICITTQRYDSRLEKLAVTSPLTADVDQYHMRIIHNMLFPIGRR